MFLKKIFLTAIMIFALLLANISSTMAAGWVKIYSDSGCTAYIDVTSLRYDKRFGNNVYCATFKLQFNEQGRKIIINRWLSGVGILPEGIEDVSTEMALVYFKGGTSKCYMSGMKTSYYTSKGKLIPKMSFVIDKPQWFEVKPNSIGDAEYLAASLRIWREPNLCN